MLAELREDVGVTQKQLSQALKVSVKSISAYENGRTAPSSEIEEAISLYFDVSLDYLHGLVEEPQRYSRENYLALPKGHSPEFRNELTQYVEFLAQKYGL